mgnify:CR=1 FL=1
MYRLLLFFLLSLCFTPPAMAQDSYRVTKVSEGVYAALATPGGSATSNAMIVDLGEQVIICGAHFSRKAINDLTAAASEISPNPIRAFVLAHHHPGYPLIDFDFPARKDVAMSIETRLIMRQEERELTNPLIFFQNGMTFEGSKRTLVLSNIGPAHSKGDLVAFLPHSGVLFASDLLYFGNVGFLGAGSLRDWPLVVEGLEKLNATQIIPGFGPIGTQTDLQQFKTYLHAFVQEIQKHLDIGDSLETTLKSFNLPKYLNLRGYEEFMPGNIERAYMQFQKESD